MHHCNPVLSPTLSHPILRWLYWSLSFFIITEKTEDQRWYVLPVWGLIPSLLTLSPVFILEDRHQSSPEERRGNHILSAYHMLSPRLGALYMHLCKYSSLSTPLAWDAFFLLNVLLHPWVLITLTYPSVSLDLPLSWRFSKQLKLNLSQHSFIYSYLPLVPNLLSLILLYKCSCQKFWINFDFSLPFTWDISSAISTAWSSPHPVPRAVPAFFLAPPSTILPLYISQWSS